MIQRYCMVTNKMVYPLTAWPLARHPFWMVITCRCDHRDDNCRRRRHLRPRWWEKGFVASLWMRGDKCTRRIQCATTGSFGEKITRNGFCHRLTTIRNTIVEMAVDMICERESERPSRKALKNAAIFETERVCFVWYWIPIGDAEAVHTNTLAIITDERVLHFVSRFSVRVSGRDQTSLLFVKDKTRVFHRLSVVHILAKHALSKRK